MNLTKRPLFNKYKGEGPVKHLLSPIQNQVIDPTLSTRNIT